MHEKSEKLFGGIILCGDCGRLYIRKYTNAKKYDRPVWICSRYYKYGKVGCKSQRIPESILIEKTEEVLGKDTLSTDVIRDSIACISVPEHNHLVYHMKDGTVKDVFWTHPSRSLSWTEEMKQAARERALKRSRKEENKHDT